MVSRRTFVSAGLVSAAGLGALGGGPAAADTRRATGPNQLVWPQEQVLPSFAPPRRLDVGDVRELPGEDQALLATLQGVVNRSRPRMYLRFGDDDPVWLKTLGVPSTQHGDPLRLLELYRDEIRGAIVYDPEVADTINIATTLAGLQGAVIAHPEQAEVYGLPIVDDLRGRFTDDAVATYRWQVEQLFSRCTNRLLTGIPPTRTVPVPGVEWREVAREQDPIRDSSNRDVYELDLSAELGGEAVYLRFRDAFTNDGWGSSVSRVTVLADGQQIADFSANTPEEEAALFDADGSAIAPEGHRFVDGGAYFIYRLAPPAGTTTLVARVDMWNQYHVSAAAQAPTRVEPFPFFRDYIVGTKAMVFWLAPNGDQGDLMSEIFGLVAPATPYLGWFSGAVAGEHSGVGLASEQGLEVLAADFYNNGTVHSGAVAPIVAEPPRPRMPRLQNKIYLTLTFGEGDNIQYCQHRMRAMWDNSDRGAVPVNWTISPLLKDVGPAIFSYYQRTATRNDLLVAGPSGAGYTYPGLWPDDRLDAYTVMTGRYMRLTGLNVISCFNIVDGRTPLTERIGASYDDHTPSLGIVLGWESGDEFDTPGGLPVIGDFARFADVADYHNGLIAHVSDWDGNSPRFVAGALQAWNWTPTQVKEFANSLDDRFEIVSGDVFFRLIRQTL